MSRLYAGGRIALALGALTSTGCGSGAEPSSPVTGISLSVQTVEWEADRNLVVLGENASADIGAVTDDGCPTAGPCPISAEVEIRSSDGSVLAPAEQSVRTPATVALIALAPGTATLTVTAGGHTDSKRVDVLERPVVLDALRVTLVSEWNDLPVQYDASQNLVSVELPDGEYAAFEVVSLRAGTEVFGAPISVTPYASNPPVTEATGNCRPVRVDMQCEVVHDLWLYGMAPGSDQIVVRGRSHCTGPDPMSCTFPTASFTAHVVEP
jgi:hypothetical protein